MRTFWQSVTQGATLLLPRSLDTWYLSTTIKCTLSTPWGAFQPGCHFTGAHNANHTHKPPHPTGYPFIHLGGEQQCGLNVLLKDISARLGNRTHDPLIESLTTNPLGHNTSTNPCTTQTSRFYFYSSFYHWLFIFFFPFHFIVLFCLILFYFVPWLPCSHF